MDTTLQNLSDERDIVQTLNRLMIGTDSCEWDTVESCFAPQVRFNMTSVGGGEPTVLKPSDITSAWDGVLRSIKAAHHQVSNFMVDVRGDRASVSCYGIAFHYLPNPSGENTRTFVGSYDFELLRRGDRWLVDLFKFNLKFIDGNRDLERSAAGGSE